MAQNVHNFYAALAAPSPGQITAGPSYIPTMLGIAVQNATTAERNQFQVLQQQHLQHLVQTGKAVYFLPRGMGMKMGQPILQGIADQLRWVLYLNYDNSDADILPVFLLPQMFSCISTLRNLSIELGRFPTNKILMIQPG